MNLLEEAIEAWRDARDGVIAEASNIPADRYDFSPASGVRDVGSLVRHIAEVSLLMVGELTRETSDFGRLPWPELLASYTAGLDQIRERDALLVMLGTTLDEGIASFRKVGEIHMLQYCIQFNGERATRLGWMHHGISQEMYHRGQLALYQRLMGLEPALTRRIRTGT